MLGGRTGARDPVHVDVDGDGGSLGKTRLPIRHHAICRKEAVVSLEHENAFGTGPVRVISASTYLRLRLLDAHTVSAEVGVERTGGGGGGGVGRGGGGWGGGVGECGCTASKASGPTNARSPSPMQLGQHLSRLEQRQLMHRRDYILRYFDALVAARGYAGVVRE